VLVALVLATAVLYAAVHRTPQPLDYVTQYGEKRESPCRWFEVCAQRQFPPAHFARLGPAVTKTPRAPNAPVTAKYGWMNGLFQVTHLSRSRHRDLPVKFIVHAGKVNVEVSERNSTYRTGVKRCRCC
jgi:hypothetical protein